MMFKVQRFCTRMHASWVTIRRTPVIRITLMSVLVFRLRNVPDEEASAIRSLLDEARIEWFETTAGNWGIAMPGLWVQHDEDAIRARELIDQYQLTLSVSQRQLYEEQRKAGQTTTLRQRILEHPLRSLGIVLFCLFILYVSIHPFLQMIGYSRQ